MKIPLLFFWALCSVAGAADFATLCADRAALERVYHSHRTGTKLPFEQVLPPALLEKLVRADTKKEVVLARTYGVTITDAMLAAEVQRIDAHTRAPEMLAEIKAALGHDPARFAATFARPIVVERMLRARFENDDALHAPQRRLAETARTRVIEEKEKDFTARLAALQAANAGEVHESVTWDLTPRPSSGAPSPLTAAPGRTQAKTSGGLYTNEATAQVAQVLSSPEKGPDGRERTFHFEDLPAKLQDVLRAQLRQPGDVSALIEMPGAFHVYLARECTAASLAVAILTVPKRSYDEWLAQQPEP